MLSSATSTMAALKEENRTPAFEAIEASGENQCPEDPPDHGEQQEDAAAAAVTAAGEQQHPMARQSSLLSLTLDEIQNTVCEPGKNFGSMNMDEFLSNIWTAEEGTAMASAKDGGRMDVYGEAAESNDLLRGGSGPDVASNAGTPPPPTSLYRQGSVSLRPTLCRKTVDEVWSEIQRDQRQRHQQHHPPRPAPQGHMQPQQYQNSSNAARQPTFGEMTLEDFLIKAGVVREGGYLCCASPQRLNQFPIPNSPQPHQNQYGMPGYGPMMTMGYGDQQNPGSTTNGVYQNYNQQHRSGNGYGGGGVGYSGSDGVGGGQMSNGHLGVGSPVSPVSSDGFSGGGGSQFDNSGSNPGTQWGADVGAGPRAGIGGGGGGGGGARKRILDGPVDKVTERRQRRMIKNRESAARSRARKQAYTVELETELNHLKEENARLHEEQRRITVRRRQMLLEAMAERTRANLRRNAKALRQCSSCVW